MPWHWDPFGRGQYWEIMSPLLSCWGLFTYANHLMCYSSGEQQSDNTVNNNLLVIRFFKKNVLVYFETKKMTCGFGRYGSHCKHIFSHTGGYFRPNKKKQNNVKGGKFIILKWLLKRYELFSLITWNYQIFHSSSITEKLSLSFVLV